MGGKKKQPRDSMEYKFNPAGYTPAQSLMREEMEKHPLLGLPPEIKALGEALDETLGIKDTAQAAWNVEQFAVDIIDDGPNLVLSLKQWHIVQGLVEEGIRLGLAKGSTRG